MNQFNERLRIHSLPLTKLFEFKLKVRGKKKWHTFPVTEVRCIAHSKGFGRDLVFTGIYTGDKKKISKVALVNEFGKIRCIQRCDYRVASGYEVTYKINTSRS